MKKLILLLSFIIIGVNVKAASGSLGVSSTNVQVGDTFSVTVNVSSAAAWNVHVTSTGPVSNCIINRADATEDALDTNRTFKTTCTATGVGTISIKLSGDVTSASDGNAANIFGSKEVIVSPKTVNNNPNNNKPNNNVNKPADNKSKNNNPKVDNHNYTLTVPYDASTINIKALPEDSKSKITGTGTHNLNLKENSIEVIVTSESGSQNKINIKIYRKTGYYLEVLDYLLKNDKTEEININIDSDTKLSSNDLDKIKNGKKTVKLNYYKDDALMYTWVIDGSKLKNTLEFLTTISYDTDNKKRNIETIELCRRSLYQS